MTRGRMIVWTEAKLKALREAIAQGGDTVVFEDTGTKHRRSIVRHFMSMAEARGLEAEITSEFERHPQPKFPENREGEEP
jgi:hypothetical protein